MKVFVGRYEHRHGCDVRVFAEEQGAKLWRCEIAVDWWEKEIPATIRRPTEPEKLADKYFATVESETFCIDEMPVE
jgi:hypothetical protein